MKTTFKTIIARIFYGETLRDKFAMTVLPEIIKQQDQVKYQYGGCENVLEENCKLAYKIADAMIKVR